MKPNSENVIDQMIFVVCFLLLIVSAGYSFITENRLKALDEKIQVRDSLMIRQQQYIEQRDSATFRYIADRDSTMFNYLERFAK
jgi:Tfp pilus assembly protein PilO